MGGVIKSVMLSQAGLLYDVVGDLAGKDEGELLQGFRVRIRELAARALEESRRGIPPSKKTYETADLIKYDSTAETHLTVMGLTKWAHGGFPTIQMGHRYVAALLSSVATGEAIQLARPPFPAFTIDLPDKLLEIDDPYHKGELLTLRSILVTKYSHLRAAPGEKVWGYIGYTDESVSIYRYAQKSDELAPPVSDLEIEQTANPFDFEVSDRDRRVLMLMGRLIINTCLAMSDASQVKPIGQSHANWAKKQGRSSPEPVVRVFQVGRPIQHDFREAVRGFITGQRHNLSVQVLVRGHYRTQHFGPKNAQTKIIWLEPFWRGPEDAPIPVRPHVV